MRILLIAPNWIGDAVMSLSLIQALFADRSRCFSDGSPPEIHVLAPPVTAPVYRFVEAVRQVQVEPFEHGKLQWSLRRQVARGLRTSVFDEAIILPNSLKSALLPWLARVPKRTGYDGELRRLILNASLPKPSKSNKPPMIEWYGALGRYGKAELSNPKLTVKQAYLHETLAEFNLKSGYLALAPGAEYGPAKRWPAEHFAAVASRFLLDHPEQTAVLHGGPKDVEFSQAIKALVAADCRNRVRVLAGQTKLAQAIVLMAGAGALVTNDSGLMHVGAALDIQVHAVFGSSSPHHTPPLSASASIHYLGLQCSPCFERQCPLGHTRCLVDLKPEMVFQSLSRR